MPRKAFDGGRLAHDIAQLTAADETDPPTARPSLMDVVRGLAPYIEMRTRLDWGDAKIAAVLTAAGYAIGAATLRSYRKRLRDEGLMAPLGVGAKPMPEAMPVTTVPVPIVTAKPAQTNAVAPASRGEGATPSQPPTPPTRPARRSFAIDRTILPPDGA